MKTEVYNKIEATIGALPVEQGGVLGATQSDTIIEYYFDTTCVYNDDYYTPDVNAINEMLERKWLPNNIFMVGIIHSHTITCPFPSCGDIIYGEKILKQLDTVKCFYLPIVCLTPFVIHMYVVHIVDDKVIAEKAELEII